MYKMFIIIILFTLTFPNNNIYYKGTYVAYAILGMEDAKMSNIKPMKQSELNNISQLG